MREFSWSDEQLTYFKALQTAVNSSEPQLLKIQAIAGSSKSTSTIEAVRRVHQENPSLSIRYLVFNSAMASEAKLGFKHTAVASTLHSLAYFYTIKPYKLNPDIASWLSYNDVPKDIKVPYNSLSTIFQVFDQYFESGYTDFNAFIANEVDLKEWSAQIHTAATKILDAMATGKMRITHAFYLKLFHILVKANQIQLKPEDIIIVDECQDLNIITLDIFHAYPAKVKVIIGDQAQSIYSFMGCVSAFDFYRNSGVTYTLSTSFRVAKHIAKSVEDFCKTHIDPSMDFKGTSYDFDTPKTHAYIFRTNLAMIRQMIKFNKSKIPYKLVTKQKIKQLFELPLSLIYATPGKVQYSSTLKVIQQCVDDWGKLPDHIKPSKLAYFSENLGDVPAIAQAIKFIASVGIEDIIDAYQHAEEHMKSNSNIYLMTAHTSKGLTMDETTLDNSMNDAIEDIISKPKEMRNTEEQAEIYLYYVACTRAKYKLHNARHLVIEETKAKSPRDYFNNLEEVEI